MLYGVDVHDGYQAGLSFPTLVRQGYTFAAVKLTQGTDYQRDRGDDWVRAARAAGLIPGAYHWLNGTTSGAAQARWFWRKLKEVGGPEGLLIQCDNEDNAGAVVTKAWAAEWEQLSGGHPFLMYSGSWWWPAHLGSFRGADLTPYLWHSHYLTADADTLPDDPAAFAARIPASWWVPGYGGWSAATILQFTSKGDAGGLGNKVDLNVTRMTRDQLLALTRSGGSEQSTVEDDDMELGQEWDGSYLIKRIESICRMDPTYTVTLPDGSKKTEDNELVQAVISLRDRPAATVELTAGDRAAIVADLLAALRPEIRDAVADLGEGGAAQVRADV